MPKYTVQCNITLTLDNKIYPNRLPADMKALERVLLDVPEDSYFLTTGNGRCIGPVTINFFVTDYPGGLLPKLKE